MSKTVEDEDTSSEPPRLPLKLVESNFEGLLQPDKQSLSLNFGQNNETDPAKKEVPAATNSGASALQTVLRLPSKVSRGSLKIDIHAANSIEAALPAYDQIDPND